MDIGRDFVRALAVVFQSIYQCTIVLTRVIACMLQTLLQMLFLAAACANTSFKALLVALHLFSNMPLYGHVVRSYINFNELLWNYEIYCYKN